MFCNRSPGDYFARNLVAIAVVALVGACAKSSEGNAVVPQPASITRASQNALTQVAFSAKYTGTFRFRNCNANLGFSSGSGNLYFNGTGKATLLGASSERGGVDDPVIPDGTRGICYGIWSGSATLYSAKSSIIVQLSGSQYGAGWHVTAGTGTFQHATGQGSWSIQRTTTGRSFGEYIGTYTDTWTGTISY